MKNFWPNGAYFQNRFDHRAETFQALPLSPLRAYLKITSVPSRQLLDFYYTFESILNMRTTWSFSTAGRLTFGAGAVKTIGEYAAARAYQKCLLVTDKILIEAGVVDRCEEPLRNEKIDYEIFSGGEAEPSIQAAEAGIQVARDFQPDAIVGIGGGSNLDLAKYVATCYAHGGKPADYFGVENIPGAIAPLICIPTTAGTGSEVSHAAVLTDTAAEMKVSSLSQLLRPELAIVDPLLTHTCPPTVTADSGIDALTHAIEACTATDFTQLSSDMPVGYEGAFPLATQFAESAIRLISEHLVVAYNEPDNATAREGMALAATLAGIAFSNAGVALVHALEYPLGGELHCSHGAGNGMLLPYVMRFNLPERVSVFAKIASWLGVDTAAMTTEEAAEAAIEAVVELRQKINIPHTIRDLGGKREQLPGFAAKTYPLARLRAINPRPCTEQQLLEILESAF